MKAGRGWDVEVEIVASSVKDLHLGDRIRLTTNGDNFIGDAAGNYKVVWRRTDNKANPPRTKLRFLRSDPRAIDITLRNIP